MNMVIVVWNDTVGHPDNDVWMSMDEAKDMKPARMFSLGYLLVENEDHVVVASTKSCNPEDDCVGNVNAIPRACIVSITMLCDKGLCAGDNLG